ncbi:MscS family membrane protein [Catalinimonas alkaloidigena]|uniref:MscS family membrane protein n=1 Tax=Catalinimonas alkaloidigena TaxID=1075417 RepID=A0A1G9E691_9BACT|nr:mechanosensitive ion channel family protein [Catalinimonas alkaloidigena]SDK71644.1 MscS family membrane protein [Catalinimonas alkaloidigena]
MFELTDLTSLLAHEILDNPLRSILYSLGIIAAWFLLRRFIVRALSYLFYRLLRGTSPGGDATETQPQDSAVPPVVTEHPAARFAELLRKPVGLVLTLLIVFAALSILEFPDAWDLTPPNEPGLRLGLLRAYQITLVFASTWILLRVVDYFAILYQERAEESQSRLGLQLVPFLRQMGKFVLIIIAFFFVLGAIFHLDISSIIAGLGIGGLAVALAGKETLENLFAAFTIFLDRPFVVGDLVQVGSIIGTVERIGFRSTQIRTLEKSVLTLPNKQMIDQPLDNLALRTFRRARFEVGLMYNTPEEKLREVIQAIEEALRQHPKLNDDSHVSFLEFKDSSLSLLVLFFVNTLDYYEYNKVREEVNLQILTIVRQHGCSFAFPSRSLYFENSVPAQNNATNGKVAPQERPLP